MNINELNIIKSINIEEKLAGVQRGSGTFKEILDNVYSGVIIPLINNSGEIVGINFDSKKESLLEDNIEKAKFELRYTCKNIMSWVKKALQLKAERKVITEVIENEEGIKVVLNTGEIEDIEIHNIRQERETSKNTKASLPSEIEVPYKEGEPVFNTLGGMKAYLRDTYDHYLSGYDEAPNFELDNENQVIKVTGIHWGRKR